MAASESVTASVEAKRAACLAKQAYDFALDADSMAILGMDVAVIASEQARGANARSKRTKQSVKRVAVRVDDVETEIALMRREQADFVRRMERCALAACAVGSIAFLACAIIGVAWPYGIAVFSLSAAAAVAITSDCMGRR